jgi:hypothetical protein
VIAVNEVDRKALRAELAALKMENERLERHHAERCDERNAAQRAEADADSEIALLQAEVARLKPSGQVAEDVAWVEAAVENRLIQFWMGHADYDRSADEPRRRARAAFSRLAALAQRTQEAQALRAECWRGVARKLRQHFGITSVNPIYDDFKRGIEEATP